MKKYIKVRWCNGSKYKVQGVMSIYFVSDFLFVARFLSGFGDFFDNLFKFKHRSVVVNTILLLFKNR
jgi:hypothetical protein